MDPRTKKSIQNRQNYERRVLKAKVERNLERFQRIVRGTLELLAPQFLRIAANKALKGMIEEPLRLALLALVATITLFCVRESVSFLSQTEPDPTGAWLKAVIAEGIILVFGWLSFDRKAHQVLRVLVLLGTALYSLFTTSGRVFLSGTQDFVSSSVLHRQLLQIEREFTEKQDLRSKYIATSRYSAAREVDRRLDQLQAKLEKLRAEVLKVRQPVVIQTTTFGLILFRLLAMVANILCLHKLSDLYRSRSADFSTVQSGLRLLNE